MSLPKIASREDFEYWLSNMDGFLDDFVRSFPEQEHSLLDWSSASLDVVEAWILRTFPSIQDMLIPAEGPRVNSAACYIGETFRKRRNGKWAIILTDPKYVYYGLPIVTATGVNNECPITLATAAADRRTGKYIRTVFENW